MRIKLIPTKQTELINHAKNGRSWNELSKIVELSPEYLRLHVKNEKVLLSLENYKKLCKLIGKNYDSYIIERLVDNWGKSKGGLNSNGSTIKLNVTNNKIALAEFVGVLLGDGNINFYKRDKKVGVYQIKIAGDNIKDRDYHLNYLKPLCESLFNLNVNIITNNKQNERFILLSSIELVQFFFKMGLKSGDKIRNKLSIPKWILFNEKYLKVCLRGLIDTDGSVFRMSRKDPNLIRINFKNYNPVLLNEARLAFIKLGFHPSKIISNNVFNISRKEDIERYLKEIGFSNPKHNRRLQTLKNSPVV